MSRLFHKRKVRGETHLLDTLNDVIGSIEKILEALEKKKLHLKNSNFSEISSSKSDLKNVNFEVKLFSSASKMFSMGPMTSFKVSKRCA